MILQKIYLYCIHTKFGSQSDLVDKAMWTDEASGAYTKYSSIAEEGSVRSIKAMFASLHTFVISGIRHA